MAARRTPVVAAVAAVACSLALSIAGCSSGPSPTASTVPPKLTTGSAPAALVGRTLRTADLQGVAGMPPGLAVARIEEVGLSLDPDPRGPCGAKVTQPDFAAGSNVGLRGAGANGFESVVDMGEAAAGAYFRSVVDDLRPGCPPWQSTNAQGATQDGKLVRPVELGLPADRAVAATVEVSLSGRSVFASQIVVRSAGVVAVVVLVASNAPPDEVVRALATAASTRLG